MRRVTTRATGRRPMSLDSQAVTALEPTSLEDGTTGLGGHAGPESVGLGPLAGIGLIGALH